MRGLVVEMVGETGRRGARHTCALACALLSTFAMEARAAQVGGASGAPPRHPTRAEVGAALAASSESNRADLTGADPRGLDHARDLHRAIDGEGVALGSRRSALGDERSSRAPSAESGEPRADSRPTIAVLDVSFYGAKANSIEPGDSAMAMVSTGRVWKELRAATTIDLADSARVARLADSLGQTGIACNTSIACARAVGSAVGATYVALAKVSKLSNLIWYFSGQLVDVASGRILMDDEFELKGVRDDMVPRGATSLARRLVRVAERRSPAPNPAGQR